MIFKPYSKFEPVKTIENIWGLDTEDDSAGLCLQAGVYNGARFLFYDLHSVPELINLFDLLSFSKDKNYFFGNNILYDLINIFGQSGILENLNNGNFKFIMTKYGFIGASYKNKVVFLDLQNYYRNMSLGKIGEIFGVPKLAFDPSSREYMKQDILISYLAGYHLVEFLQKHGYDFSYTIGGIALKAFMRYYLKTSYNAMDENQLDILRRGYKGGRCEMYHKGECSPVHIYDVNSLYPYIMKSVNFFDPNTIKPSNEISLNGIYCVRCSVKPSWLPLIPEETSSIYPVGSFQTVALGSDLIDLKDSLDIKEILWGFSFNYCGHIFKKYSTDIYRKRMESQNKFENLFFKLMLNNLYGKFGVSRNKIIWKKDENKFDEIESNYEYYAYVIWSIQVTSNARKYMHGQMISELDRGNELFYTDTDSLHVNKPIRKKLIDSKTMGLFKHEGTLEVITYEREKEYYDKDFMKFACKGIHGDLKTIKQYFETGETVIKRPIKLKESLKRNIQPNVWIEQKKRRRFVSPKRQIFENGETFPLILNK